MLKLIRQDWNKLYKLDNHYHRDFNRLEVLKGEGCKEQERFNLLLHLLSIVAISDTSRSLPRPSLVKLNEGIFKNKLNAIKQQLKWMSFYFFLLLYHYTTIPLLLLPKIILDVFLFGDATSRNYHHDGLKFIFLPLYTQEGQKTLGCFRKRTRVSKHHLPMLYPLHHGSKIKCHEIFLRWPLFTKPLIPSKVAWSVNGSILSARAKRGSLPAR